MSNIDLETLAKEIAVKLIEISEKEVQLTENKNQILELKNQILELEEKNRVIEQQIHSNRFLITDRLNRPVIKTPEKIVAIDDYADGY